VAELMFNSAYLCLLAFMCAWLPRTLFTGSAP
jgi:hypothetical protein